MFTLEQKRNIADAIQTLLHATGDPELPEGEISFDLHVHHAENHRFPTIIRNNGSVAVPTIPSATRESGR